MPDLGAGTRLMWIPAKSAFRAGSVSGPNWNDVNIGYYSFVGGGSSNTASGLNSFVGGGTVNTASGYVSFVGGGASNTASGNYSFVGGGGSHTASGDYSFTGGGQGLLSRSYAEAVFGSYNTDYTPVNTYSFNAPDRIFVIGNGIDFLSRSNAVTVLKSGAVGIGIDVPTSKLHVEGGVKSDGPNSANVLLSSLSGYPNNGTAVVIDAADLAQAGIVVDAAGLGVVFGDVKSFVMQHPEQPDKDIWYASLEGPEAGAYERGTAVLQNGEAFVPFSDHYRLVANPETMTVLLTPTEWDTYGLAVVEKTATGFRVKELKGGTGNFAFDWEVKCVRKGFEDYRVVRDKRELQFEGSTKK